MDRQPPEKTISRQYKFCMQIYLMIFLNGINSNSNIRKIDHNGIGNYELLHKIFQGELLILSTSLFQIFY